MNKKNTKEFSLRINEEIPNYDNVRLIDGETRMIVSMAKARALAQEKELDLIELNAKAEPPVLTIGSYEKLLYSHKRQEKKNKPLALKEIQLSVNIAKHDIETKAKKTLDFISKGHTVKVVLMFKGRELTRREESKKSLYAFLEMVNDSVSIISTKEEYNKVIVLITKKK